jgi:hypothetical protein
MEVFFFAKNTNFNFSRQKRRLEEKKKSVRKKVKFLFQFSSHLYFFTECVRLVDCLELERSSMNQILHIPLLRFDFTISVVQHVHNKCWDRWNSVWITIMLYFFAYFRFDIVFVVALLWPIHITRLLVVSNIAKFPYQIYGNTVMLGYNEH